MEPLANGVLKNKCGKEESNQKIYPAVTKRTDYLQWDDYFMAVAFLSAQRSKDPKSQVSVYNNSLKK